MLQQHKSNRIIDLASCGGGGLVTSNGALRQKIPGLKIVLTDYFPNRDAFDYTMKKAENFEYIADPVDARQVPEDLEGIRTMLLSFHHFNHSDAKKILYLTGIKKI